MNDYDRYGGLPGGGSQVGPAEHTLGGFEERLLAALMEEVAGRAAALPAVGKSRRWRRRAVAGASTGPRRWNSALLGATAVGAAGAAAIALIAANGAPAAGPGGAASGPAVTATRFLRNAALAALQTPAAPPKPGQFVYSKILTEGPATEQEWISADGTRTGLGKFSGGSPSTIPLQACVNGFVDPVIVATRNARYATPQITGLDDPLVVYSTAGPGASRNIVDRKIPCTPGEFAAYQPDVPTTEAALRSYLSKMHQTRLALGLAIGVNRHLAAIENSVWSDPTLIRELMTNAYLSPQQRAAMYRLLEHAPGLRVLPRVTDLQGKVGIGIGVPWKPGTLKILIFDPKTYALLGGATRFANGELGWQWVLVQTAIVNKVGQTP